MNFLDFVFLKYFKCKFANSNVAKKTYLLIVCQHMFSTVAAIITHTDLYLKTRAFLKLPK